MRALAVASMAFQSVTQLPSSPPLCTRVLLRSQPRRVALCVLSKRKKNGGGGGGGGEGRGITALDCMVVVKW